MTGPSGSGKTTLLTLMGGLRSVEFGSLQFLGQELHGANKEKLVQAKPIIYMAVSPPYKMFAWV